MLDDYTRALGSIPSATRSLWEGGREGAESLILLVSLYKCLHQILISINAAKNQETCLSLQILQNTLNAGKRYIFGSLRSRDLRVQCWWVRHIPQKIDPISRSLRQSHAIRRRKLQISFCFVVPQYRREYSHLGPLTVNLHAHARNLGVIFDSTQKFDRSSDDQINSVV